MINDCGIFSRLVEKYFGFLREYGFERCSQYEVTSGTLCKVVYLGKHVAIEVYLDIRDDYVGVSVLRVINGVPKDRREGGFHMDLEAYLRKSSGFRRLPPHPTLPPIEAALATWAEHLRSEGQKILADLPDSLSDIPV